MARPLRIQAAGLSYHITARGSGGMVIYRGDGDRDQFLELLGRVVESYSVDCHAYCLMTTHYHLVVTTSDANLSNAMKQLNGTYGQWWNRRHDRAGHVFQGRFGAQIIQDDPYLLTVCRYVVLNPVRAQFVQAPEQWPWSSYRATAGLAAVPSFLRPHLLWHRLGDGSIETMGRRYREFVGMHEASAVGLPIDPVLGDAEFVERFNVSREGASREVPRRERLARPPLATLFASAATRAARSTCAARAYALGYTMAEIGRYLELHISTISRMITRVTTGVRRARS